MATRSIISVVAKEGYKTETGSSIKIHDERISWFGRYCHWDGYPEHMAVVIKNLVKRFGVEGAKTKLMATSWSTLGTNGEGELIDFETIGEQDPIGKTSHESDPFLLEGGDSWGTEYRYLIKNDYTLDIYKVSYRSENEPDQFIKTILLNGAPILLVVK